MRFALGLESTKLSFLLFNDALAPVHQFLHRELGFHVVRLKSNKPHIILCVALATVYAVQGCSEASLLKFLGALQGYLETRDGAQPLLLVKKLFQKFYGQVERP